MKKLLVTASALALSMPLFAQNFPLYMAGDFNGWDPAGAVMTDQGGGVWNGALSGLAPGLHQFKVTQGNWDWSSPAGPNSWFFADGSGNASVSIDLNTYADGWSVSSGRIDINYDPGAWNAVGSWNGWNNADPGAVMTHVGDGIYELQRVFETAGSWAFKATESGGWSYQVGADGRNVNASEFAFTTTFPNQEVHMFVNAINGTISAQVIPEPSALALLGVAGLAIVQSFRRRD